MEGNLTPKGWSIYKLDNICTIKKGEQLNKTELDSFSIYPCLNGGTEPSGYTKKWNTGENTITISEGGNSCGYVNFIKHKFWSGGHCYTLLDLKPNLLNDFLYQSLKGVQSKIMDLRVGSGLPNIQQKAIKKFKVLIPDSIQEQQKIASVLSKIDEAIAQTEAFIVKYKHIKTGLIQDLLSKGIDGAGNIRSEETHEFKDSLLGRIPVEWTVNTVLESIESIEQGWSPSCNSEQASTNEWGVLKTTAVTWEKYSESENKKLPTHLTPKIQYEVKNGDVLITRAGPNSRVGVVVYVNTTRSKLIFSDKIYRLTPNDEILNEYLAIALSSDATQNHLSNFKTGMAESQTNISQKIVGSLNLLVPPKDEQEKIISGLNQLNSTIIKKAEQHKKLIHIKNGLMEDLLSGKIRVTHLLKETIDL